MSEACASLSWRCNESPPWSQKQDFQAAFGLAVGGKQAETLKHRLLPFPPQRAPLTKSTTARRRSRSTSTRPSSWAHGRGRSPRPRARRPLLPGGLLPDLALAVQLCRNPSLCPRHPLPASTARDERVEESGCSALSKQLLLENETYWFLHPYRFQAQEPFLGDHHNAGWFEPSNAKCCTKGISGPNKLTATSKKVEEFRMRRQPR